MEKLYSIDHVDASLVCGGGMQEKLGAIGRYRMECLDKHGNLKWVEEYDNVVTTQGKNSILDTAIRGQTQITTWYLGLVSSVSYSAVAAGDTAAQINGTNGWKEAGPTNAPDYTGTRKTLTVANPASGGSLTSSTAASFVFTGAGTVKGSFLVSVNTKEATTGTLLSAGLFTQGDRAVQVDDTVNVTYQLAV